MHFGKETIKEEKINLRRYDAGDSSQLTNINSREKRGSPASDQRARVVVGNNQGKNM